VTHQIITPSDAELRAVYDRSGLDRHGMSFEQAVLHAPIRLALTNGVAAKRARQARQAQAAAIPHQVKEAA